MEAAKSFDLQEYFQGREFEADLERFIKEKTITNFFILETLGEPTDRTKSADANITIELWTYQSLDITLTFRNGIVYSYSR